MEPEDVATINKALHDLRNSIVKEVNEAISALPVQMAEPMTLAAFVRGEASAWDDFLESYAGAHPGATPEEAAAWADKALDERRKRHGIEAFRKRLASTMDANPAADAALAKAFGTADA